MGVTLHITAEMYEAVRSHVLQSMAENAAFLFVEPRHKTNGWHLKVMDVHCVPPKGLTEESGNYYLELTDEERSRVIVEATRRDTALVEVHSHPFTNMGATFSYSDLRGFEEFVPHVWWRLRGKPYAAVVFSQRDCDALAWTRGPDEMEQLDKILVGDKELIIPTGNTLNISRWRWWK